MLFKGAFRHEKEKALGIPFHLEIATLDDVKELLAEHGLVAVPVEPTEDMLVAARDWSVKTIGHAVGNAGAIGCYKAMTEQHKRSK